MPPYTGPNKEVEGYYSSIFVRHGDRIVVTSPGDTDTRHDILKAQEDIPGNLSSDSDAGRLVVDNELHAIFLTGESSSLLLPRNDEARKKTAELVELSAEGYAVIAETNGVIFFQEE